MIIRDESNEKPARGPTARKRLKPVTGEQIRLSPRATLLWILLFAVMFVGGAVMTAVLVYDGYQHVFRNGPDVEVLVGRLVAGVGGLVGAPYFGSRQLRKVWRGRRVVIGVDRVQIVEGTGEDVWVVMSLPYENIEAMKRAEDNFGAWLEIEVRDTHDPDTHFAGTDVEDNFRTHGYHYKMIGGYQESIEEIEALIRRAQKRWRKKRGQGDESEEEE